MKKVLIIEDDINIVNLLKIHLKDLDFEISVANNGNAGFSMALTENYNLVILDVMLPGLDGISICIKLRAQEIQTPILMLTAKSEEIDKVLGLECGADDYLTKPFGVREFIARVKAIVRRQEIDHQSIIENEKEAGFLTFEGIEIDTAKRRILIGGKRIELTPKEFDLLTLLAKNPGKSYNRDQLLDKVWGYDFSGYEHTVNSHINRLRAKIEHDVAKPKYILTTWGHGYRFNDEI